MKPPIRSGKVTWIRDDPRRLGAQKITHPKVFWFTDADGDVRYFATAREAREHYAYEEE